MPTGSYDSSVVSAFTLTTQPLSLFNNVNAIQPSYQPITFWSNNYLATYTSSNAPTPITRIGSPVIITSQNNSSVIIIDSNNISSPNVFVIG